MLSWMGAHGEGTVYSRADGRLVISVTLKDGTRASRYIAARLVRKDLKAAAKEAERLRKELVDQRDADLVPTAQTLSAWLRWWLGSLRDAKRARIRPRTLEHYAMIAERHIIPALGKVKLERLSERDIQRWLDADPAAPQTIHHHRAVLRRALNVAVRQRIISRNPAIAVELPDPDFAGAAPLTVDEAKALLAIKGRLAPLWRLALDTGSRQGELLGLGWTDIDLDAGTVTIAAQLQRILGPREIDADGKLKRRTGSWARTPTKAARTLGRIAIGSATVAALRAHKLSQAEERESAWRYWGHVFLTPKGEPYHGSDVLREFHAACAAAGIESRRFHDLRASAATLMGEAGVPENVRMARLGHATTRMARHYSAVRETADRDASDRLEAILR